VTLAHQNIPELAPAGQDRFSVQEMKLIEGILVGNSVQVLARCRHTAAIRAECRRLRRKRAGGSATVPASLRIAGGRIISNISLD
jgi:hypothetical protein